MVTQRQEDVILAIQLAILVLQEQLTAVLFVTLLIIWMSLLKLVSQNAEMVCSLIPLLLEYVSNVTFNVRLVLIQLISANDVSMDTLCNLHQLCVKILVQLQPSIQILLLESACLVMQEYVLFVLDQDLTNALNVIQIII